MAYRLVFDNRVVALGTDYNILIMARVREEAKEGRDPRTALAVAFRHSAPTIASAGVILAGSFATLTLAGNSLLAEIGFAIASGITIVAIGIAILFTPPLTALIGHATWWPGHGDKPDTPLHERPLPRPAPVSAAKHPLTPTRLPARKPQLRPAVSAVPGLDATEGRVGCQNSRPPSQKRQFAGATRILAPD